MFCYMITVTVEYRILTFYAISGYAAVCYIKKIHNVFKITRKIKG